jgi:antitoxin ParD1/3/4
MPVTMPPDVEQALNDRVQSGEFPDTDTVLREAVSLLDWRKELTDRELALLRAQVAEGLAQLDRGEGIPGELVFAEIREKSRAMKNKKAR